MLFRSLLKRSKDYWWFLLQYFKNDNLEFLRNALVDNQNVKEIRILMAPPKSNETNTVNEEELCKIMEKAKKFKEQYDKINFDLKVATSKEIINKLHDRFFHTKDHSYNFTDFGLVSRSKDVDISDLKENREVRLNQFTKYWNDEKTYSIFGNDKSKLLNYVKNEISKTKQKNN